MAPFFMSSKTISINGRICFLIKFSKEDEMFYVLRGDEIISCFYYGGRWVRFHE